MNNCTLISNKELEYLKNCSKEVDALINSKTISLNKKIKEQQDTIDCLQKKIDDMIKTPQLDKMKMEVNVVFEEVLSMHDPCSFYPNKYGVKRVPQVIVFPINFDISGDISLKIRKINELILSMAQRVSSTAISNEIERLKRNAGLDFVAYHESNLIRKIKKMGYFERRKFFKRYI